jgi:hypothetical protein
VSHSTDRLRLLWLFSLDLSALLDFLFTIGRV